MSQEICCDSQPPQSSGDEMKLGFHRHYATVARFLDAYGSATNDIRICKEIIDFNVNHNNSRVKFIDLSYFLHRLLNN